MRSENVYCWSNDLSSPGVPQVVVKVPILSYPLVKVTTFSGDSWYRAVGRHRQKKG